LQRYARLFHHGEQRAWQAASSSIARMWLVFFTTRFAMRAPMSPMLTTSWLFSATSAVAGYCARVVHREGDVLAQRVVVAELSSRSISARGLLALRLTNTATSGAGDTARPARHRAKADSFPQVLARARETAA
jgi:hypothetical protein